MKNFNIIKLTSEQYAAEFIYDEQRQAFVKITENNQSSLLKLDSQVAEGLITRGYYRECKKGLTKNNLEEIKSTILAKCLHDGEQKRVYIRYGFLKDGIEIDLGDDTGDAIFVSENGWIIRKPECYFFRPNTLKPLPRPHDSNDIEALKAFLNCESQEDFLLILGFILCAMKPDSQYPLLILQGEQGCGKSVMTEVIRRLVDPAIGSRMEIPKRDEDLHLLAKNAALLSFDNLSGIKADMSDSFCRFATGAASAKRKLYSDSDLVTTEIARPIILNGIDDIASRPDLVSRSIILTLQPLSKRAGEEEFWGDFIKEQPKIFGALLNGLVSALRNYSSVELPNSAPRMASAIKWVEGAIRGYKYEKNSFLNAFAHNQSMSNKDTAENSPLVLAIVKLLQEKNKGMWEGTVSELLTLLSDSSVSGSYSMPRTANGLSGALTRLSPALKDVGIRFIRLPRNPKRRLIRLETDLNFSDYWDDDADDRSDGLFRTIKISEPNVPIAEGSYHEEEFPF
jgi:hypothetical protein